MHVRTFFPFSFQKVKSLPPIWSKKSEHDTLGTFLSGEYIDVDVQAIVSIYISKSLPCFYESSSYAFFFVLVSSRCQTFSTTCIVLTTLSSFENNPNFLFLCRSFFYSSQITCHISHVTYHMTHITCHRSHITCHRSHVTYHISHITCHISRVTYHMSQITYHVSHITCHISHVTYHVSQITCHISRVTDHTSHITDHVSHITCHRSQITCH